MKKYPILSPEVKTLDWVNYRHFREHFAQFLSQSLSLDLGTRKLDKVVSEYFQFSSVNAMFAHINSCSYNTDSFIEQKNDILSLYEDKILTATSIQDAYDDITQYNNMIFDKHFLRELLSRPYELNALITKAYFVGDEDIRDAYDVFASDAEGFMMSCLNSWVIDLSPLESPSPEQIIIKGYSNEFQFNGTISDNGSKASVVLTWYKISRINNDSRFMFFILESLLKCVSVKCHKEGFSLANKAIQAFLKDKNNVYNDGFVGFQQSSSELYNAMSKEGTEISLEVDLTMPFGWKTLNKSDPVT